MHRYPFGNEFVAFPEKSLFGFPASNFGHVLVEF